MAVERTADVIASTSKTRLNESDSSGQIGLGDTKVGITYAEPDLASLPLDVQRKIKELEQEYNEGEITDKGYQKRRSLLLSPYLICFTSYTTSKSYGEDLIDPPLNTLPKHVIKELENLQQELDEEEITEKGFVKKRTKLLAPYMLKEPRFDSLPSKIQAKLRELERELDEGDITEKGHRKKRGKLIAPFLVRAFENGETSQAENVEDLPTMVTKEGSTKPISIQIIDGGEKLFKCQICNEVFKQAQSFSGHCRLHRSQKAKVYKCHVCSLTYTTRSHLKFHMYKHTGNFPYKCDFCGKGFAGRSQHRYHVLRHSGKSPFVCKFCGGRFWKKKSLDVHIEKHKREMDGFFQCKLCHALFQSEDEKLSHLENHETCIKMTESLKDDGERAFSPHPSSDADDETVGLQNGMHSDSRGHLEDCSKAPDNT